MAPTRLTASFSYSNSQGYAPIVNVLTASYNGIKTQERFGSAADRDPFWTTPTPVAMSSVRNHTSIATNSFNNAYAVVEEASGSQVWEYRLETDLNV